MAAAAITLDGFSIREYTAKIRAKDVEKCWPFDGKQVAEEMLPPLTFKKFRWWSDELQKAVEEEEDHHGKEVFNCCSSLRTHISRCLKMKDKKIQRKRSIVEIFAKAPQIERGEDLDEDEILANVKKKKKKKKKSIENFNKKGSSFKKEKTRKLKGSMQASLVGKLKKSVKGKNKLISKRNSSSKHNVTKIILASKLTKQNQKPKGKSVQGILKKCGRVTGKRSAVDSLHSGDPKRQCWRVGKHVRFSGKDRILGWSSSTSSLQAPPEVLSDHMVLSSMLEKEDNVSPIEMEEVNEHGKEVMPGVGNQPMEEKEVLDERDGNAPSTFWSLDSMNSPDRGHGPSDESVRITPDSQPQENLHRFSHDNTTSSHNTSYPSISWLRDSFQQSAISTQNSIAMESTMSATSMSSTLSLAKSRNGDGRHPSLSQDVSQQLNSCNMQYHPYLYLSPKELMARICSLVDSKKKKTALCGDKSIDDDFVGLPLNSQGELIKLHSSSRGGLNQLRKQSMVSTAGNSSVKNSMNTESPSRHLNKGDGCTESTFPKEKHDVPSRMSQPTRQLDLDLNKMSTSNCACSHYSQPEHQINKENNKLVEKSDSSVFSITQPTMRLMGKDVTVGRNNKEVQGFEEDKVWTDKNVINEQHRDTLVGKSSLLSRNFEKEAAVNTSPSKWKETRNQSLGHQRVPIGPYFPQMDAVDPRLSRTYHNWGPSVMPQGRQHLTMENRSGAQMRPFSHSLPSEELMSKNFRMPAESPNLSSHTSSFASSQYPCQCARPNSAQGLYDQGLGQGSSGFRFPFVSQPCGKCAQQSRTQTLPHWMLNVSQQNGSSFVPSEYGTRTQNHPYSTKGSNYSPVSSQYFTSMVSQPLRHAKSLAQGQNSSDIYSDHQTLISASLGFKHDPSINASYKNRLYRKNIMKPQTVRRKDLDHAKQTRKKPTDKIDHSVKYPAHPFREVPAARSDLIGTVNGVNLPRHDTNRNNQTEVEPSVRSSIQNTRASFLDTNVDPGRYAEHSLSAVVNNSSKDTVPRSGPTKLSAGVKHILKPSPNPDQDHSRLIHSTIPFRMVSNSDKVSDLQKKPSKIYKL